MRNTQQSDSRRTTQKHNKTEQTHADDEELPFNVLVFCCLAAYSCCLFTTCCLPNTRFRARLFCTFTQQQLNQRANNESTMSTARIHSNKSISCCQWRALPLRRRQHGNGKGKVNPCNNAHTHTLTRSDSTATSTNVAELWKR